MASTQRCQFDGHWQLHQLSKCLIFVSAASFRDQRGWGEPIHFTGRRWSEGEAKLARASVIAQSSLPQITADDSLFLCRNNCTPAFQNTKAGFAFVHKMGFRDHATPYLHNQKANCNIF